MVIVVNGKVIAREGSLEEARDEPTTLRTETGSEAGHER